MLFGKQEDLVISYNVDILSPAARAVKIDKHGAFFTSLISFGVSDYVFDFVEFKGFVFHIAPPGCYYIYNNTKTAANQ